MKWLDFNNLKREEFLDSETMLKNFDLFDI